MPDLSKMNGEALLQLHAAHDTDMKTMLAIAAEIDRRTDVPKGHVKLDDGRVVKVCECSTNPLNGLMYITTEAALAASEKGVGRE